MRVLFLFVQECSDERLRMCNELLQGIKSLKLYAWERIFSDAVEKLRRRQLKLLFKGSCIAAITSESWFRVIGQKNLLHVNRNIHKHEC